MESTNYEEMQESLRAFIRDVKPNLFITHNFWGKVKAGRQLQKLELFYSDMQRKTFGAKWAKQFDRDWPMAFGFREHPNSNPHYHVLMKGCDRFSRALKDKGPGRWRHFTRGQLWVETIHGPEHALRYCTKHLTHEASFEDMFIYSDTRNWS